MPPLNAEAHPEGAARLLELLSARGQSLAFCESLTAGLAAATFADTPGASAVLRGGLVTYATDLKVSLAGVPAELISRHGVVSAECASAMATGARKVCGSDWAVSLTGVAGPDSQDGHPVGEVWIGVADPDGGVVSARAFGEREGSELAGAGRAAIRVAAVRRCFELLGSHIEST